MEHHESRKELDKAQRDDVFRLIDAIVEHVEYYTVKRHKKSHYSYAFVKEDIPALKSLKAMVENYPAKNPAKMAGKTVTRKWVREQAKNFTYSRQEFATEFLTESIELLLAKLGIKVTNKKTRQNVTGYVESFDTSAKQVEDSGDVRHE